MPGSHKIHNDQEAETLHADNKSVKRLETKNYFIKKLLPALSKYPETYTFAVLKLE
jgi:hypothetical protein